jgi:hypothetical protein
MSLLRRVACVLLLCAAAGTQAKQQEAGPSPSPGHGAMLMTVTVEAMPTGMGLSMYGVSSIIVERVDGDDKPLKLLIAPDLKAMEHTRVYAASLAPGRYRIVSLCAACGKKKEPLALPDFRVIAGQTSWLGGLMLRVDGRGKRKDPWVDHWGWHEQPALAPGQRLLDAKFPELAAANTLVSGGWEPLDGADAAALRDEVRLATHHLQEPMPFGANGFQFGALQGVIKRWVPGGPLQMLDTGTPFALRSVVQLRDGRLLAGGEATTLLSSSDDGRTWQDVSAGLPFGLITQIVPIGADEVVFPIVKEGTVALYRGRVGGDGWTLVGDYPLQFAFWTGLPGQLPELHVVGRTLAMSLPSRSGVYLDLDSGQSHRFELPGGIAAFSYDADGVMRCRCTRSIATNPWESHDLGRTWVDSPLDRWQLLPVFKDASTAFSFKGSMNLASVGVLLTEDATATWRPVRKPTEGWFVAQAWSADGSTMLLSGAEMVDKKQSAVTFASTDRGATWTKMPARGEWLYAAAPAAPEAGAAAAPAQAETPDPRDAMPTPATE